MSAPENLRRTPLYAAHVALGAKIVPFGGWEMPVLYSSIAEEHRAVRGQVGLFDVSHMGELIVAGPDAEAFLNRVLANDIRKCQLNQGQYTFFCNDRGGIIDDLIYYRLEPTTFLLVVNAGNIEKDFAWLRDHLSGAVTLENHSDQTAAVALQGPSVAKLLAEAARLPHFYIGKYKIADVACRVARTGYTGEDGFEILCDAAAATKLWTELLARGAKPCGLGARDTLRLEMCYPLHGSDINSDTTPLEAGLGKFVALDKPDFIGREALLAQKQNGLARKLVAFKMTEKSPPPRSHYPLVSDERVVGEITSGAPSPSLGIGIGMGYVETALSAPGTQLGVDIRGKTFAAVVQTKPLWKKTK